MCASWASEQASLRKAFTAWVAVGRCAGALKKVQGRTGRHMMQRLALVRLHIVLYAVEMC